MEVILPPDLEKLIAEQVASGLYPSPGEVVRDALRLLQEQIAFRMAELSANQSSERPTLKELLLAETPRAEIPVLSRRRTPPLR